MNSNIKDYQFKIMGYTFKEIGVLWPSLLCKSCIIKQCKTCEYRDILFNTSKDYILQLTLSMDAIVMKPLLIDIIQEFKLKGLEIKKKDLKSI
jgi:hypothetical protein